MAAALAGSAYAEMVPLRHLRSDDLEPLLVEETAVWRRELSWDFAPSAALVHRYLDMRGLDGFACCVGGRLVGYIYFVEEDHKALIGDVYVLQAYAGQDLELRLLQTAMREIQMRTAIRRAESQLLLLRVAPERLPAWRNLTVFDRLFMMAGTTKRVPEVLPASCELVPWNELRQEEAAHLIADCYREHIDSRINDQYRDVAGARRFLLNIVQYPGCGAFFAEGAVAAIHRGSGRLAGLSLTSLVGPETGHITQICVGTEAQGRGIGAALLAHSLNAFADRGCRDASLTVTGSNESAVRLYRQYGFTIARRFRAYVWQGWR